MEGKEFMEIVREHIEEPASSTDSPKDYTNAFRARKRRKTETRRKTLKRKLEKMNDMNDMDICDSSTNSTITFPIVSSRDTSKQYIVSIHSNKGILDFSCNCGDQFGVPTRTHCRHIGIPIMAMFKHYVNLHFKNDDKKETTTPTVVDMDVGEIDSMFKKFMQIKAHRS